jgi:hypothetical protein
VKSTWGDEGWVLEPVSIVDFTDFVSIWNLITKQVLGRQPGQARPAGFRKAGRETLRERERVPSISSGTHQYSDSFIYHCPSIIYSSITIVLISFVIFVARARVPGVGLEMSMEGGRGDLGRGTEGQGSFFNFVM